MKRIFIGGIAAVSSVMMVAAASAADLPARSGPIAAPVPFAPAFTWTGFYAGINAGYAFGENKASTRGTAAFAGLGPLIVPGSLDAGKDGFIGGGQIGYNYQMGAVIVGAEADIQFMDRKRTTSFIGAPVLGTQLQTSILSDNTYLGTVRARLGFTPADRLMIYATAGLAYGNSKTTAGVVGVQAPGLVWAGSSDKTSVGWTLGAGAEYALTNNITFKAEYLYYDLGRETVTAVGNPAVRGVAALNGIDYVARVENTGNIVRAGVNYKF